MVKKPSTIFLKKDWGRLGKDGYPVVAFSKYGMKSFYDLAEKSASEECWIVIVASKNRKVKPSEAKGCFICLIRFEYTEHPQPTRKHITDKAYKAPHRQKNGEFRWPYCVKIEKVCFTEAPYTRADDIIPNMHQYHGRTVAGFDELTPKDCEAVYNFFKDKGLNWVDPE